MHKIAGEGRLYDNAAMFFYLSGCYEEIRIVFWNPVKQTVLFLGDDSLFHILAAVGTFHGFILVDLYFLADRPDFSARE